MSDKSFQDSGYYGRVLEVRDFMFDDIDKTLQLIHTPRGAPNFLLALGPCCYTEYWGKLLLGIEGNDKGRAAFEAFLKRLDCDYYQGLLQGLNIYGDIRCGLAHSYLIEGKSSMIDTGDSGCHGIEYDKGYTFWIRTYFEEFKKAVNCYIQNLENGTESSDNLERSLKSRPELV